MLLSEVSITTLEIQRIYDMKKHAAREEEERSFKIFVDRLWARGIRKEDITVDLWLKDIAPSDSLRKWFGHDPRKWNEFKKRYFKELDGKKEPVELILQRLRSGTPVLLLYGAKDEKFNNAVALKEYLLRQAE
ncbi:hypothetical protein NTE_03414 [Candidatus Nitrososphaera evergladensis SR1]|uniref:DUF488 family protein n=2 Tax=Nitrososphaera TaxID=497726 RepID=A0A075MXU8_9ARCH|nr:hypothetical protein NTE_03414 [Candidatus Nitrososphaera evergladensis SR1]